MSPQPVPAAEGGQRLNELETAADTLRDSALCAQAAVAAQRAAAMQEGAQAVMVAAYCRRLERLASLLKQYDAHSQHTLAGLGLGQLEKCSAAAAGQEASQELADALQALQQQLAAAALESTGAEPPTAEALLELANGSHVPACLLAAGAPAVLAALQGELAAVVLGPCWSA